MREPSCTEQPCSNSGRLVHEVDAIDGLLQVGFATRFLIQCGLAGYIQTRIVAVGAEPEGEHAAEAGHRAKSQAGARSVTQWVPLASASVSISVITGRKAY